MKKKRRNILQPFGEKYNKLYDYVSLFLLFFIVFLFIGMNYLKQKLK